MTPTEFKVKWAKFSGKESSAYQDHFSDLCRMLRLPTPIEVDPSGSESFCFQKRVVKDAELFTFDDAGGVVENPGNERGFADVWKRDCFCLEYKGPGEDLEKAYKQLLRYRESLLNPPLLVVCDFKRLIVRTNFNGAVQESYEFTNAQLDSPEALRVLRAMLTDPGFLRPQITTAEVTEKLARQIAEIALSLQKRESVELSDAKTRRQHYVSQKKNLRIARFLNRLVFCFFAEDTALLPPNIFAEICNIGIDDPQRFSETLEDLFRCMAKGGRFGSHKIRHFNGHLFEDATVFELTPDEIHALADAAGRDWQNIEPSIMGNLFERGLDPDQRAQLGAHYTSEEDIKTLLEPVLMAPLRREWSELRRELAPAILKGKATTAQRGQLTAFQGKLAAVTVLDPACGSGNFLYVALQLLLGLEKEIIAAAAQLGWTFAPKVSVRQLRAIELNAYAFELAQVSVQIGYLQWRRDNGFDNDSSPVLQNLTGFENKDALLNETFRKKPQTLKAAQAEEHGGQDELFKVYTERAWPECDVIVGNPPFLGTKKLRGELGDGYVKELFNIFGDRIPNFSDLCCYWFEKARQQIEDGNCKRAGLLATQGIRGGLNREVLNRIKKTGNIFFALSDHDWILAGANVHVSMVGFDNGVESARLLDGEVVASINPNLTSAADITKAIRLTANRAFGFIADVKAGQFDLHESAMLPMLHEPNPHGRPNSDVLVPWVNSLDVLRRPRKFWIVDFGPDGSHEFAAHYAAPYEKALADVYPLRAKVKRKAYRDYWWLHAEPCAEMRAQIYPLRRFLVTTTVSKHRVFAWLYAPTLPDHQLVAFGTDDDYCFGVLHSRFHEVWALKQGTRLETRPRYTPTTCFETFPFPFADDLAHEVDTAMQIVAQFRAAHYHTAQDNVLREEPHPAMPDEHRAVIAATAKELNELRERWLNPPEWTETRILEFPGSVSGPWKRYLDKATVNPQTGVGTVRYPRLEPHDADCAAKLKKRTLTNLYNERPAWLDLAHKRLDAAVAAAYGWPTDLADQQILERLLALNLERAAAEKVAASAKKSAPRERNQDEML